jgi:hypothetical protein
VKRGVAEMRLRMCCYGPSDINNINSLTPDYHEEMIKMREGPPGLGLLTRAFASRPILLAAASIAVLPLLPV